MDASGANPLMSLFGSTSPSMGSVRLSTPSLRNSSQAMSGGVAPSVIYTGSAGSSGSSSAGSSYMGSPMSSPRMSGRGTSPTGLQAQFPSSSGTAAVPSIYSQGRPTGSLIGNVALEARDIVEEVLSLPLGLLEAAAQIVSRVAHLGADGLHHANQAFSNAVMLRHGMLPTASPTSSLLASQYPLPQSVNPSMRTSVGLSANPTGFLPSTGQPAPSTNPFNNPPGSLGMAAPMTIAQQASLSNQAFVSSRPASSNPTLLSLPAEFSFL